ncbi:MAG: transposase [Gemmataceae bacterium]
MPAAPMGDWLTQAADLLTPLHRLMHQRLLLSRVIHGDDTGLKLRVVVFDFTAGLATAPPGA